MSKVVEYVGWFHTLKDRLKENWTQFWHSESEEEKETNFRQKVKDKLEKLTQRTITRINHSSSSDDEDFSHLTRTKTRAELIKISAAVMGIEFSYAAETAFVSPLLLNIGLRHRHMTLMWCLSPLFGFFLTPLMGSMSDGCHSRLGKRRPFIILLSVGIILGLILVPNGQSIGRLLGDVYKENSIAVDKKTLVNPSEGIESQFTTSMAESLTMVKEKQDGENTGSSPSVSPSSFNLNPIDNLPIDSYKHSPRHWTLDERFGRRHNYMTSPLLDEREQEENLKNFQRNPMNKQKENKLENLFKETLFEMNEQEDNSSTSTEDPNNNSSKNNNNNNNNGESNQNKLLTVSSSSLSTSRIPSTSLQRSNSTNGSINEKSALPKKQLTPEEVENESIQNEKDSISNHPWGLVFTVIGTVLLDFDADACQSPARAYMLDVTIPEDHARGLSTFTIMAGLGGSMGYFLGALNWENTFIGTMFGTQVRAVFSVVLFIFIGCVITTIRSFREIPIDRLWTNKPLDQNDTGAYSRFQEEDERQKQVGYGTTDTATVQQQETSFNENIDANSIQKLPSRLAEHQLPVPVSVMETEATPTFREYVKTIVQMPKSLQWLCLTNFFCWMSLVCYSLYFTDFVGEAVFDGDPQAARGSQSRINYENGVRFGCWGMSLYSLSCSIYSLGIERLVQRFGAKNVYIYGQLVYSVGMIFMAIFRHPAGVIIFSWTAGIMYATLFTMPYLLVARYHAAETFDVNVDDLVNKPSQMRGLGTDVAIVSSMVFLAQMTQALVLGNVVAATGTTTAIVLAASLFAGCGALSATKVLYLDL